MTEKLYYADAYAIEFEAKALLCERVGEQYKVLLDKTLFFPEEGGQSPDKGTLNGIEVCDVQIDGASKDIFHFTKESFSTGETVKGKIDFDYRFRNMQMHSGEHIFSGLMFKRFGLTNVGFHLSDNGAHMDFDGKLTKEEVLSLEEAVNRVIVSNAKVITSFPSKEELASIDYRAKKEIEGQLRLVEIEGADICACCAPHVLRTGEIGIFKVLSVENYKGGIRVCYLCGFRALEDYNSKIDTLTLISTETSAKRGEEARKVKEMNEELLKLRFEKLALTNSIIEAKIRAEKTDEKDGKVIIPLEYSASIKFAMEIMHRYYNGRCSVLCGDDESGYRYFIESSGENLIELSNKLKNEFGAKGGGKPESIQGSINEKLKIFEQFI